MPQFLASRFDCVPVSFRLINRFGDCSSLRRNRNRGPVRFITQASWSPSLSQSTSTTDRASSGKSNPLTLEMFANCGDASEAEGGNRRKAQFLSWPLSVPPWLINWSSRLSCWRYSEFESVASLCRESIGEFDTTCRQNRLHKSLVDSPVM